MRRLASSWANTLSRLGYRRSKRKSRHGASHRRSSIESLEPRHLLSITVNTLVDQNDTYVVSGTSNSLREAIAYAATQTGPQTIDFDPSLTDGTIDLDHGQLTIASDLTINGLGKDHLTINGRWDSRVFLVWGPHDTINDLKITHGGNVELGAGIYNGGDLTLNGLELFQNYTTRLTTGNDQGAGIYSINGSLHLINSTVDFNNARWDAGVSFYADDANDVLQISGSTFYENEAKDSGGSGAVGGLSVVSSSAAANLSIVNSTFVSNLSPVIGGIYVASNAHLVIVNSTVSDNYATGTAVGGILSNDTGSLVTLFNTIVAGNFDNATTFLNTSYSDQDRDVSRNSGSFDAASTNNIIGVMNPTSIGLSTAANITGTQTTPQDPGLYGLGDNGGPTLTVGLMDSSIAIDRGSDTAALLAGLLTDQRGSDRLVGTVDIGALEFKGPLGGFSGNSWNNDRSETKYGFPIGWELPNVDHLILYASSLTGVIRWVRSDGRLIDFDDFGDMAAANDDDSMSQITDVGSDTYVRIDKYGDVSTYHTYDGVRALLTSSVDRLGVGYEYSYNPSGEIQTMSLVRPGQDLETTTYNYGTSTFVEGIVDPFGRTVNITYSSSGRPEEILLPPPDPSQPTVRPTFTFVDGGVLSQVTDPDDQTTVYNVSYSSDFYSYVQEPDGETIQFDPMIDDLLNSWRSELGEWATYLPEFRNKRVPAEGTFRGYQIDELGRKTALTMEPNGQIAKIEDPGHQVTEFTRNAAGQATEIKVTAGGNVGVVTDTTLHYDTKYNLIEADYLDGTYETWSYDSTYNEVKEHDDRLHHQTLYDIDPTTGNVLETRVVVGSDDRTSSEHDDEVTKYTYTTDGLVSTSTQFRNDVNGTPQLSLVTEYSYSDVANTSQHIGRWLDSTTYGGDDPTTSGISLVNPSTISVVARNDFGMPTTVEDEVGRETQYTYDDLDRLTKITLPDPGNSQPQPVVEYVYSLAGLLTDEIDTSVGSSDSIVTHYEYDPNGRLKHLFQDYGGPNEAETSIVYDAAGNITQTTNALNQSTHFVYDVLNRPIAITQQDPDGSGALPAPVTYLAYNALGHVIAEIDPNKSVWKFGYNSLGEPNSETDPDGNSSSRDYDDAGNLTSETDAEGRVTTYTYDDAGRLASMLEPGETTPTTYTYDSAGNLRFVTDPLSNTTEYVYDERNRLVEAIDADGKSTLYTYTDPNELESLTDPDGNETTWEYDGDGRVSSETNELSYARTYRYDAYGRLTQYTDRDGRITKYDYDNLNHPTDEKWYNGTTLVNTITYDYDALGNLLSVSDPNATYGYVYDGLNRQTSAVETISGLTPIVEFDDAYDNAGRMVSASAKIGSTADYQNTYTYDASNRLATLIQQSHGGNAVSAKRVDFGYNAANQLTSLDRYAGITTASPVVHTDNGYDATSGLLTSIVHTATASGSTFTESLAYGYDDANRLSTYTNSVDGMDATYEYDAAGQLTGVAAGYDLAFYDYDDNGNRVDHGIYNYTSPTHTIDDDNRLESDGNYIYDYDHEGNLVERNDIATSAYTTYAYDHRNRLVEVDDYDTSGDEIRIITYKYDAFNQLIEKSVDITGGAFTQTVFVNDGGQVALQFDKSGSGAVTAGDLSHRYLWGPAIDQLLADEQVDWSDTHADGPVFWALTDGQGSVESLVDSNGILRLHRKYDAFGNVTGETHYNASGSAVTSGTGYIDEAFEYTGRWFDKDTGLQNNLNRWYDPQTGRFISQDPAEFAGDTGNLYRYTDNAPTLYTDPFGLGYDNFQGQNGCGCGGGTGGGPGGGGAGGAGGFGSGGFGGFMPTVGDTDQLPLNDTPPVGIDLGNDASGDTHLYRDPKTGRLWGLGYIIHGYGNLDSHGNFVVEGALELPPEPPTSQLAAEALILLEGFAPRTFGIPSRTETTTTSAGDSSNSAPGTQKIGSGNFDIDSCAPTQPSPQDNGYPPHSVLSNEPVPPGYVEPPEPPPPKVEGPQRGTPEWGPDVLDEDDFSPGSWVFD